jgi:hypothetical protein
MKNQNDSPQPLKSKLNCRGMGCSFGSASSLQMVTSCSMTKKHRFKGILTNMSSLIGEQEQWALPGIVGNVIFMTQQTLFLVTTPISCPCEQKTAPYAFGWLL